MQQPQWLRRFQVWWNEPWSANPRIGMILIIGAALVPIIIGAMGPSVVTLELGPRESWLPPYYFATGLVTLNEWVAVVPLWLSLPAGAIGLRVTWRAVESGWRPSVTKLLGGGIVLNLATILVPPMTSADVLMYAAYGRLQYKGVDPYEITPAEIFRQSYDPVLYWTEKPWQDTPSVYGPITSFSQWLAASLGGNTMHDVVFWLQVFAVVPFIVIGVVAVVLTRGDVAQQSRAVLFTLLNPIMIWSIVSGAHNEALCLVWAILALLFIRHSPYLAGMFIGLAGCCKVTLVFYGVAMVWAYRFQLKKLVQLGIGTIVPLAIFYGLISPKALFAAARNSGYRSSGSWAPGPYEVFKFVLGDQRAGSIIVFLGWSGMVVIAWMLSRVLPWKPVPGLDPAVSRTRDPLTITTRTALVLNTAWLVTSPYSLSWYDLIAWAPLALLAASRLDWMMIWRGAWLSLGYVTGRPLVPKESSRFAFSQTMLNIAFVLRDVGSSIAQMLVLYWIVTWWISAGKALPTRAFVFRGWRKLLHGGKPKPRVAA